MDSPKSQYLPKIKRSRNGLKIKRISNYTSRKILILLNFTNIHFSFLFLIQLFQIQLEDWCYINFRNFYLGILMKKTNISEKLKYIFQEICIICGWQMINRIILFLKRNIYLLCTEFADKKPRLTILSKIWCNLIFTDLFLLFDWNYRFISTLFFYIIVSYTK